MQISNGVSSAGTAWTRNDRRLMAGPFRDGCVAIDATAIGYVQGRGTVLVCTRSVEGSTSMEVRSGDGFENIAIRPARIVAGILRVGKNDTSGINLSGFHQAVSEIEHVALEAVGRDITLPPASLLPSNRRYEMEVGL